MFFAPLSAIGRVGHPLFPIVCSASRAFHKDTYSGCKQASFLKPMSRSCSIDSATNTSPPSNSAHGNLKFHRRPGKRHPWTELTRLDDERFSLLKPDPLRHGWFFDFRMYGGDLACQALFCAQQTVESHLRLSSFHSYYCSPGLAKPLEFQVKKLRDGRHNSYRRVEVSQDGKMVYHAEFMFKRHNALIQHDMIKDCDFPQVPSASTLRTSYEIFEELVAQKVDLRTIHGVAFKDDLPHIEHRPCNGAEFLRGPDQPSLEQCLWLRYKLENFSNDANFADLILVYLSDMGICFAGAMPFPQRAFKIIASVDLNGWIHAHNDIQPNGYFLYQTRCMVHSESKSLNLGKLWTADGRLVATVVQDALIEPKPESKM